MTSQAAAKEAKEPPTIEIKRAWCKGCAICVEYCPAGVLVAGSVLNRGGVRPVEVVKERECSGCGNCTAVCPDCCIEIVVMDEGTGG